MPTFMKLGNIRGESGDARFPGWIPVEGVQFQDSTPRGAGASSSRQTSGQAAFQSDITITLRIGRGFVEIQQAAVKGDLFPHVIIVINESMTLELTDALISGISIAAGAGGEGASAIITLNFKTMTPSQQVQFPVTPVGPLPSNRRPAGRRR